jgi:hypothetical protein
MQPQKEPFQSQPAATSAPALALVKSGHGKPPSAPDKAAELERQKTIGAKLVTRFAEALRALA